MLELGRRERNLLSGLGVQVLVVGVLVFAYTQAARQLKVQRELCVKLLEQLSLAKEQIQREGQPDIADLQAQGEKLMGNFLSPEALADWVRALESQAQEQYGFRNLQVKVGSVEKSLEVPTAGGKPSVEVNLTAVELEGNSSTRNGGYLLAMMADTSGTFLRPLESMELKRAAHEEPFPVAFRLKWLVATSSASGKGLGLIFDKVPLSWGRREEPFQSPLASPSAVRITSEQQGRFRLTGILWDPSSPTCVINGIPAKPGDLVEGYQLILVTPKAVLLQGLSFSPPEGPALKPPEEPGGEVLLFLSS